MSDDDKDKAMKEENDRVLEASKKAHLQAVAEEREVHRAIGRFVVEFSQLDFSLRHIISNKINLIDPYFDAVLGWWDFAKLCQTLRALYEVDLVDHPEKLTERKEVISQVMALNDERVKVVHSVWTPSLNGGSARRVTAGKTKPEFHYEDIRKLDELSNKANKLIMDLYGL